MGNGYVRYSHGWHKITPDFSVVAVISGEPVEEVIADSGQAAEIAELQRRIVALELANSTLSRQANRLIEERDRLSDERAILAEECVALRRHVDALTEKT